MASLGNPLTSEGQQPGCSGASGPGLGASAEGEAPQPLLARMRGFARKLMLEDGASGEEVPPYSPLFELRYFFATGVPLGLAAMLNWGVPPLLAMIFAGHTQDSARLQSSLGYGRVWFNCTMLMPTFGLGAYFGNAVPGCIGANREDRIPRYLQRSQLLTFLLMLPLYSLQFVAGDIMQGFGVPAENASDIRDYCRMMVVTGMLIGLVVHLETAAVNLGYTKCATFNSLLTGVGIDILCTYLFIYRFGWGIHGAALAQLVVQSSRVSLWMVLLNHFGILRKTLIAPENAEPLLSKREFHELLRLGIPQILGFFAGWLIFEFQLLAVTRIDGITADARAAGAVWIQIESALASAQDGWIRSTNMRILNLLGKQDAGTPRAFMLFNALSLAAVGLTNIPFMFCQEQLARFVSNDAAVREWLYKLLWVLVAHTLTRITFINTNVFFVPLGRGMLGTFVTFISFYCVATPIACFIALTDVVTTQVAPKMLVCVGATSIAQGVGLCIGFWWLSRLDWSEAGRIINERANMDRGCETSLVEVSSA